MVAGEERHADATDKIGRAVKPGISLKNFSRRAEIVNQHHGFGAVAAEIVTERGPLPVDFEVAGVAGIERALAIADAGDERAPCVLAKDIAIGAAGALEGIFDGAGKTDRDPAEESVSGLEDLVPGEGALVLRLRWHITVAHLTLRRGLVRTAGSAIVLGLRGRGRRPRFA